jgi:hypothetical protein
MRTVDRDGARVFVATLTGSIALASLLFVSCTRDHGGAVVVRQGDCYTCHRSNYEDPANAPPHPGLFPTTCAMCHTETEWIPAMPIDHPWFVLANRHLDPEVHCSSCHGTDAAGYAPGATPNQCEGCHMDDYDVAARPPHVGEMPTTCDTCHTDAGWVPSTFSHGWPLDGAHTTARCSSCHGSPPTFAGTPRECNACHADDRAVADAMHPEHVGVSLSCQNCHTTTNWDAAYAHPEAVFPIAGGAHGPPITCADCHDASISPTSNRNNANCIGCHEHTNAAAQHREVSGYGDPPSGGLTANNFCLRCHPAGRH